MSFLRVGFYLDLDILYYWIVTQFKINNYNNNNKIKVYRWHKLTLQFLKHHVFFSSKIKLYKQIEYNLRHNGNFTFLHPQYYRFRFKKKNIMLKGSDYNFLVSRIYLNHLSQVKSNKYNYRVTKNKWIINYSAYDKTSRFNLKLNFFINQSKIKNINQVLIKDNYFYTYNNQISNNLKYYLVGHNYFFVAAFWLFQKYELMCYMLKYCCRSSRKNQKRWYRDLSWLYGYYFLILKIYNNIVNIIINLANLKNTVFRSKKFTFGFFNKKVFNYNLLSQIIFSNEACKNKLVKFYLNKHLLSIIAYSDENINMVKNYKLKNNINYQDIYLDNLCYFGNSVGNSRFLNYGSLLLTTLHRSNLFKYYNLSSKYLYNLLKLKTKATNYIYWILNSKKIDKFIHQDIFYFYMNLKIKNSSFKLWQWYTFFYGCDFHVNWGWFGFAILKRNRKTGLIEKVIKLTKKGKKRAIKYLTPSVWMLNYVNDLF